MNRRWAFVAALLLVSAGALAIRLAHIEDRPMHGDEAVHALKFQILFETGRYEYDLNEFHGPTIYYFALPIVWLAGVTEFAATSEWMFRLVPVLFGVGTILLLLLFRDAIGTWGAICAGVLTAVSPAMVFYSPYYIQESVLVFFTFGAIVCGWRYVVSRRVGWAIAGGLCIGLMHATKETCIIAYGCMFGALVVAWVTGRGRRGGSPENVDRVGDGEIAQAGACGSGGATTFGRRDIFAACVMLIVATIASTVLFSALFANPAGIVDSVRAYGVYFDRAGASGIHEHPWYYYIQMLLHIHLAPGPVWSEAFIVALSLVGMVVAARSRRKVLRFLAAYAILMVIVYSIIPYKTPWCMLSFLHALVVLAGVGAVAVIRTLRILPLRIGAALLLLLGTWNLYTQASRSVTTFNCDGRNPYVYAHPVRDVVRLAETIERLAEVHPAGHNMLIRVITPDYWPLPWYLRQFHQVGYWDAMPEDCDAAVIITSFDLRVELEDRLSDDYFTTLHGLRPSVVMPVLVEQSLWKQYVDSRRIRVVDQGVVRSPDPEGDAAQAQP